MSSIKKAFLILLPVIVCGCAPSGRSTAASEDAPKMYQGQWDGYTIIYANPDEPPRLRSSMADWELRVRRACEGYGRMEMQILVGPDGAVDAARINGEKGHPCEPIAIWASRSILFEPGREDGAPVTTIMTFAIRL